MKVFYLLLICLVFLLTACSPIVKVQDENAQRLGTAEQADAAYTPVTIENINEKGDPIAQVYERPPERVVAVWQNSIETLLALGVGDRIVAGMGACRTRNTSARNTARHTRRSPTRVSNISTWRRSS